jgi:hypothetical protein
VAWNACANRKCGKSLQIDSIGSPDMGPASANAVSSGSVSSSGSAVSGAPEEERQQCRARKAQASTAGTAKRDSMARDEFEMSDVVYCRACTASRQVKLREFDRKWWSENSPEAGAAGPAGVKHDALHTKYEAARAALLLDGW